MRSSEKRSKHGYFKGKKKYYLNNGLGNVINSNSRKGKEFFGSSNDLHLSQKRKKYTRDKMRVSRQKLLRDSRNKDLTSIEKERMMQMEMHRLNKSRRSPRIRGLQVPRKDSKTSFNSQKRNSRYKSSNKKEDGPALPVRIIQTTKHKNSKKIVFLKKKNSEADSGKDSGSGMGSSAGRKASLKRSSYGSPIRRPKIKGLKKNKKRLKIRESVERKLSKVERLKVTKGQKSESTQIITEPSSNLQIQWESSEWPKIEANLIFGQCIGEGSFAKVYDGFDKILKKAVAVKVIKKKHITSEKKRRLVQMEVDIIAQMNHKNVVKFERLLEDHKRVSHPLI
jgi:hypothetical protein